MSRMVAIDAEWAGSPVHIRAAVQHRRCLGVRVNDAASGRMLSWDMTCREIDGVKALVEARLLRRKEK